MGKYIDSEDVKILREKMKDFASMVNEIAHAFKDIQGIKINKIDIMDFNTILKGDINIPVTPNYLDFTVEPKQGKTFTNIEDIKDLLESALKESHMVEKGKGIHSLFKTFLINHPISFIHPMMGSTKDSLINNFDKLLSSQDNYELTFAQKIKKFKQ